MSRYTRMALRLHYEGMSLAKAADLVSRTYKVDLALIKEELHEHGHQG